MRVGGGETEHRACAVGKTRALGIPACASPGAPRRQQYYLSPQPAAPYSRPFRVLVAHGFRQSQRPLAVRGIRERRLAVASRRSGALPEMVRGGERAAGTRERGSVSWGTGLAASRRGALWAGRRDRASRQSFSRRFFLQLSHSGLPGARSAPGPQPRLDPPWARSSGPSLRQRDGHLHALGVRTPEGLRGSDRVFPP